MSFPLPSLGAFYQAIAYRVAFGPNAGKKALTLQAVPASDNRQKSSELVSNQSGFSLHAVVACKSNQRKKLKRLCRYITRPTIAEQCLSLASNGNVVVVLKTPYDDGTSHVVLSPMEFTGRLEVLVPKPRVNLTRFHGFSRRIASCVSLLCLQSLRMKQCQRISLGTKHILRRGRSA